MADYVKMAEGKKWKKLAKVAQGSNMADVAAVAEACGNCRCEEAYNIIVDIMARPEGEAKIAGVKGMAKLRYDVGSQITRIIWQKDHCAADVPGLDAVITEALDELHSVKR